MTMKMTMAEFVGLEPCPFCGGEANTLHRPHVIDWRYSVGCNDDECRGFIGLSWLYKTEAEAIEAWNTRHERTCHKVIPDEMEGYVFCSECGAEIGEYGYPNYCPNCGAKVVGE